jgi:hypothetical protein
VGLVQNLSNNTDKPVFLTQIGAEKQTASSVERAVNRIRKLFPEQHLKVFFVTYAEEETDDDDEEESTGGEEESRLEEEPRRRQRSSSSSSPGDLFVGGDGTEVVQIRNFGQRWEDEGQYRRFLLSEGPNRGWLMRGNFYLHGTIGDGACFYHAVAKALNPKLLKNSTEAERRSAGMAFKSKVLEKVNELGESYFNENNVAWVGTNISSFNDFLNDFSRKCTEASYPDIILYSMKVLKDFNLVIIYVTDGTFYCTSSAIDRGKQTIILGYVSSPKHFELVVRLQKVEESFLVHARHDYAELEDLVEEHKKSCRG